MKKNDLLNLFESANNRMKNLDNETGVNEICPISIIDMSTWEWAQGVGLYGMQKYYAETGKQEVLDFLVDWFDNNIRKGLPAKNVNTMCPLLTLTYVYEYTKKDIYLDICKEWSEWVIKEMPRTEEMGLQHIVSEKENHGQVWIDTLFMTVLFMARMGKLLDREDYKAESVRQYLLHIKYLTNKKNGLFDHGFDFNGRHAFGEIQWGRGNSWYTSSVVDYLDILGELDMGVKWFLLDTLHAQVQALEQYQNENGMWHTLITDKESYVESSATAGFAYGILKAVRLGYIPEKYRECGIKALEAIIKRISQDGTVTEVSYGTAICDDAQKYKEVPICPMTYGQALTLMLLTEALKLEVVPTA
ncbi:glycoside hydrolase family 88/105 protein [Priestia filamentosa]|uniref:beta-galactosidase BglB n=1 Tax=Priestia filamentosa TaxID=1402861 RepID=UPI002E245B09|nr:glycoside hydrolase family 88 protein [Priestia filamentosa]